MAGDVEITVRGIEEVTRELNKLLRVLPKKTLKGLIRAGIAIWRRAEPLTPVDTGNLRASFFMVTSDGKKVLTGGGQSKLTDPADHAQTVDYATRLARSSSVEGPTVVLGYTAEYAMYVHEKLGAHFQRPGAQPKFLEAAIKQSLADILRILQEEARL